MTARLYLIGDPVAHSLSPLLHGAMIAQTGADCTYEARRVRAAELPAFLTEAKAACAGFNVTMPLKEAIVPLLDGLDASARECGAVNTVCIRQGRAIGHNTDGSGFVDSLCARGIDPAGMTVLLVEQNALATLEIADRGYVIEVGQNVMNGDSKWLLDNEDMKKAYLGI